MADELNIVVVANADEEASSKHIAKQLPSIADKIASIDKLQLQATIDLKSVDKSIQVAVNKANSLAKSSNQIKFTPTFNTSKMDILKSQLEDFANEMAKLNGFSNSKVSINTTNTGALKTADIQYYNEALKQTITDTYKLETITNDVGESVEHLTLVNKKYIDNTQQFAKAQDTEIKKVEQLKQNVTDLKRSVGDFGVKNKGFLSGVGLDEDFKSQYKEIVKNLTKINDPNSLQNAKNNFKDLESYIKRVNAIMTATKKLQNNVSDNMVGRYAKSSANFDIFAESNKGYTQFAQNFKEVQTMYSNIDPTKGAKQFATDLNNADAAAQKLKASVQQIKAGESADIFNQKVKAAQSGVKQLAVQWDKIRTNKEFSDEYDDLVKSSEKITTSKGLSNFNAQLTDYKNRVKSAGLATTKFGTQFKNALSKFGIWLTVGTTLMSAVRAIKDMVSEVVNLDKALVNLQMATGGTYEETYKLLLTYNKMAQQLGTTTSEVADSANTWLRQGKSIAETNELIEATMVMSKVGMMDSATAAQYLTSALKGYKLSASDALSVVDKLSKVDMMSATDVAGLAEAMSRVATSAGLAGISMDKLIGYIATIGEVTQKDLSSVGESLKTVFARMGNVKLGIFEDEDGTDISGEINDVEKILTNVDIKLRDSALEFRDFGDVLDEVAGNWSSFSKVEQSAIANAFAGKQALCLNIQRCIVEAA